MKNKIYILLIVITLFGLQSCEKYLDVQPESQSIATTSSADAPFFQSANAVEAALAGVYNELRNEYFLLDYYVNGDAQSDDAYAGGDNPNNFQLDEYKTDATNKNVSRDWGYLYSMIGKANQVINNVDAVADMNATRKKQVIGEASFLRAFAYFQAVQLWGDVPLQLKEVKSISASNLAEIYPVLFPARSPEKEVYAQIIKDLETALANVRTQNEVPNKEYITKGAANALLAKVYATTEPRDWNKVKQYCDAVISGGYTLVEDFDSLWKLTGENSTESIFESNNDGKATYNWGPSIFVGVDWKKFNTPTLDLAAAFDAENDKIRKNSAIKFFDVTGKWNDQHWTSKEYPFINKWRDATGPQNYIYLRLADILLLKAEALNQLGDVAGALTLVNQVRARVKLNNITAASKDAMALAIEKERRLELAFEGHRWYDLKRNGRLLAVVNAVKENGKTLYNATTEKLVWPIPQSELDKNTKLTQNKGY